MIEETKLGVSRRTLAKGAAWSVPAAAVIAVAPSVAASPMPCVGDLCFGCASVHKCCSGGPDAMYWACVSFTNSGDYPLAVTFAFDVMTSANGMVHISGGGTVPANSSASFKPETPRNYGNCSTGTYAAFTIDFSYVVDGVPYKGSADVPGGSLDGGGNTCPKNTDCTNCAGTTTGTTTMEAPVDEAKLTQVEETPDPAVEEKPLLEEGTGETQPVEADVKLDEADTSADASTAETVTSETADTTEEANA